MLKNRGTKLLLVQVIKGTIVFNCGTVGTPGVLAENPKVTGCRLLMRQTKVTSIKQRVQSSLSHDDEGGKGSKSKAKKAKKPGLSLK
jgi:hypothetical protein